MSDHLARSFDRSFNPGNLSLESRVSWLEAAARAAHEQKMRELEERARKAAHANGVVEGIMASTVVVMVAAAIIGAIIR